MEPMKLKSALIVAVVASAFSVSAQATTIFSDNFDSYTPTVLDWTPPTESGWKVTAGSVDLIGTTKTDPIFDFLPNNGSYIDLDGISSGGQSVSGLFANSVNLNAGTTYTLSFDLAGSQRGNEEFVAVKFGNRSATYALLSSDPFATSTLNFKPLSSGLVSFSFQNLSGDDVGALLDNVSVTTVPEPKSYALFLAGIGIMGAIARRRTSNT